MSRRNRIFAAALLASWLMISLVGCGFRDWNRTGDHPDKNNYALTITPTAPIVTVHHSIHLSAHSPWGSGAVWSVSPASIGTIDKNGVFTAADHTGTGTIIAMWKDDVRYTATAVLKVVAAPVADITLTSPPLSGTPGTASVLVQSNSTYRWTLEGGTIDAGQGTAQIQYTPTAATITRITCTVTNEAGDSATGVVVVPPVIHYDPVTQPFVRGRDIGNLTPTNTGGAATSWAITPSLPPGLAFNPSNGVISGIPTAPAALAVYAVTANNAGGTSNPVVLTFTVIDPAPIFSYIPNAHVFTINVAIPSIVPTVTSGTATTWSISPGLPAGLAFGTSTGQISGIPSVLRPNATYTVTASNIYGTSSTAGISIEIIDTSPVIHYAPSAFTLTKGENIAAIAPTNTGGPATSWAITPLLPPGLVFDTTTGSISGKPTALSSLGSYSVTATNTGGTSPAVSLSFTVVDVVPSIQYPSASVIVTDGSTLPPFAPVASGGSATSWNIQPSLPPGLVFDSATGTISGIPSTTAPAQTYSVTASNTGGTSTPFIFVLTVVAPPASSLSSSSTSPLYGATVDLTPAFSAAVSASIGTTRGARDISSAPVSGTPITTAAITTTKTYWLRATNAAGDYADSSVTVTPQTVVVNAINPPLPIRTVSTTTNFSATATGGTTNAISWTASAGSMNAGTGAWMAPANAGSVTITATSQDDPTKSVTTTADVVSAVTVSLTSSSLNPFYGATVDLLPTFAGATSATVGTTPGGSEISSSPVSGTPITTAAITTARTYWLRAANAAGDFIDSSATVTPQTVVVSAISPSAPTRTVDSSTTFSATATGGVTNGITWAANAGTINASTGAWTAPTASGSVTITATSQDDSSKAVSTDVHVVAAATASLNASSTNPVYGASVNLTPTFTGATSATVGTSQGGSDISSSPANGTAITTSAITMPRTYWLRATNGAGDFVDSSVTVTPQTVVVNAISPPGPTRTVSSSTTFSTTASGGVTNGISWSASAGTINANTGAWTAPAAPGSVTITATSKDDNSKTAATAVEVVATATASLNASSTNPLYGATVSLTPTFSAGASAVLGTTQGGSDISSSPVSGTPITTSAITTPKTYWLRATNAAGDFVDSSVTVTPQTVVVNAISPSAPTRTVNSSTTFSTTASGGVTNGITWSASAGTINANTGAWTAPAAPGSVTITATSQDDASKTTTTSVNVVAAATASINASSTNPLYGATVNLTPTFSGATSARVGTTQGGNDISSSPVSGTPIAASAITTAKTYWLRATNAAGDFVDSSVTVNPQTVVVNAISPSAPTRTVNGSTTFSTTASGGVTNGITWSASAGTINANTGAWTAPAAPGSVTITATSKDDSSKTATTTVNVVAAATASINASSTSPLYGASVDLTPSFTGALSATVGTTQGASDVSLNAVNGTPITASGITSTTTYWLRATNAAGDFADSSVTVIPQTVTISGITKSSASISVGYTATAKATVSNAVDTSVSWSATGGSFSPTNSASGVDTTWTAPVSPGTYTLTAASAANPLKTASTTITVYALPVATSLTPSTTSPLYGATINLLPIFSAGTGAVDHGVGGVTNNVSKATSAVTTPTTFTLTVTNTPGQTATATSGLVTPQTVVVNPISPASPTRTVNTSTTFSTTATGGVTNTINWSASSGGITSGGVWTAPAAPTTVTVSATSADDPSKTATTSVTVIAAATASITASTTSPLYGATVDLTPTFSGATSATVGTTQGGSDISASPTSGTVITTAALTTAKTFWLRATNAAGSFVDSSVTVTPKTVTISGITKSATNLSVGYTATAKATVSNALDTSVNWTATGGTLSPTNTASGANTTWTAPATPGTYTLTAKSAANPTKTTTATITVYALPVATSLTPSTTSPLYGDTVNLTPVFSSGTGSVDHGVGSVTSNVSKASSAITAATTFTLTVTNTPGQTATVSSAVVTPQIVVVDAPTATQSVITTGGTQTYTTTVHGALNSTVTWTASGGSMNASTGSWTAPGTAGTYTITATSVGDPSKSNSTTVNVVNPPVITSFTVADPLVSLNHGTTLNAIFTNGAGTARIGTTGTGSSDITNTVISGVGVPTGNLSATVTFTLTVYNEAGSSATAALSVTVVVGSSTPTGDLSGARYAHTSTLLPNGQVFIAGGRSDTAALDTSQLYDLATSGASDAGTMVAARFGHTASLLANNTVLLAGGNDGTATLATSEIWSGSFTVSGTLNTAREKHTATLLPNGKVLVVGGLNGSSPVVSAELYDPSTRTFTYTAGNLNTARYNHTATLLNNGKVLIAGGSNGSVPLKSAELFDPSTGAFTVVGSMATARQRHSAVLLDDGRVAIIGGQGSSAPLTSAEIFSSSGNSFTNTTGSMANARDGLTATLVTSGKVIVAGGINAAGNAVDGCEILDPTAGTFGLTTLLASARTQHTATLLQNGFILIAGGRAQSGATSAAELIDPQDGLTPTIPDATVTAPVGASRSQSGLTASVPVQTHVQNVWMINGGTITAGQGTRSITFSMPSSGTATLDVLVTSDRIVPSHHQFVVTPKPVITAFGVQKPTITVGTSTNLLWTVEEATSLSIDQGIGSVSGNSTVVTVGSLGTTTYTLTATNAGGSTTASTSVLAVPPPIATSLTAAAGTVPVGGNTTLTPIFSQGVGSVSPSIGTVSSGPAYPTPAISTPTTFTLTVTNAAGDTAVQSTTVDLQPVVVTGISGPGFVTAGHKAVYTATVAGSVNTAVTWQTTAGTIDGTGLTAPTGAPYDTTETPITITATSINGGTPATLVVQVVPLPTITSFTSTPVTANYGGSTTITPVFSSGSGQIVGLGSVTTGQGVSSGPLTASKTFTLVVTNVAGDTASQNLTINQTTPGVTVPSPSGITVTSGTQTTFSATTTGSVNSAVTWSGDGGTFSGNRWTAPGPGTYTITASSVSPAGYSANTTITVVSAPVISGFTATPSTISTGGSTMLQANFSGGTAVINPGSISPTSGVAFSSGALAVTTTYTLSVTNAAGTNVTRTVTVNVVKGVSNNSASTMATGRTGHTVTLLADGRVLIAGGSTTPSADLTDTQGSNLTPTASAMQAVRYYHTATLLADGTVLLAGGSDASGVAQNTAELFNPANGTFTSTTGLMTQARQQHTAAILNDGRVFLSGGKDSSGAVLSSAEIYDPIGGTFSSTTDTAVLREGASATRLLNGTVLIAGGDNGTAPTNSGQIYNGAGYSAFAMAQARSEHTATLMPSGNVFLAGGTSLPNALDTTELFSGASFASSATFATPRYGHVGNLLASGLVYLAGGSSDGATPLSDSVIFDSSVPTYWLTGNLATARFQPRSTILRNGHVLVAGGSSDPTMSAQTAPTLNTVEIYDPQDSLTPALPSAAITAPTSASDNASGLTASVPMQSTNVSYVWSLTNGTITAGVNTRAITFTHTSGVSVLSVLVISDRQIPVQSSVTINPAPTISSFSATPSTNTTGLTTILSWSVTGAAGLTLNINNGVGDVSGLTSTSITTPATNMTYTLTATDANGTATRSVTLTVVPMPTATSLAAALNPVEKGSSTTIVPTFTTNGSASIDHGIGNVLNGVAYPTGVLNAATTFALTSTNSVGTTATYSTTINIMPVVVGAIAGPTSVTVNSASSQFGTTVSGAVDKTVTWSVSAGSIDAAGQFTAPATTQDVVVTATSVADPAQHNQLTVHVIPVPLALSMTAATDPVLYGAATTITPHFSQGTGVIDQGIGTVTDGVAYATGTITANKTFTLRVTNTAGDSATFPLTVHPQPVVVSAISGPASGRVTVSRTTTFSATVSGAVDTSLTWSSAGAGSWSGAAWTAPSTPGSYTITATAVNGSTNTLPITVVAAPVIASFIATPPGVNRNQSSTLTATFSGAGTGGNSNGIVTPGNLSLASGGAGVTTGPLTITQSYTLTVTNDAGDTATAQTTVQVFLGAFGATSNGLTLARNLPTATLEADGNVLVAGGGNGSANVDLFNGTSLSFSAATPLLTGRNGHAATLLPNGLILVTGGSNGASALASAELYNPADGSFVAGGIMQQARKHHRAILLDSGKVLLVGGTGQSTAELYDPVARTCTATSPMASVRESASVSRLPDGRILVAGGTNGSSRLATAEIFDPSTNSFSTAAVMRSARQLHTATTLTSGKILIAGGTGSTGTGSAELFDPSLMRFVATADMVQPRQEHVAVLLPSGMVLLAGGNTGLQPNAIDQAELFDPAAGTFLKTDFMSSVGSPSTGMAASILRTGQVLVTGGTSDGSTVVAGSELYTSTDGLAAPSADATITTSEFVPQGSTGVAAHVTGASGARYVWMVSNGTLVSGQGTASITFNMPATGAATLDVLIITDRFVPSHGVALVVGEPGPVIASFIAGLNPVPYGGSTSLIPTFSNATAGAVIGTGSAGSSDVTASAVSGVAVPVGPVTAPTQYRLTATNRAGVSVNQLLTLGVQTIIVSAVTPPNPTVSVNKTQSFSATVSQAVNTTVLWSVTGGSIDASGVWTAPATPGTYTITATAAADGTTFTSTTATVVSLPAIQSFTATPSSVNYGQASSLSPVFTGAGASVAKIGTSGAGSSQLTSTATSGGAVSTGPVFADTTYTLTVTNAAGDSATGIALVTVVPPFSLTGPMSLARWGQTATVLPGGTVLVAGGTTGADPAELYSSETFTLTPNMKATRSHHTATLLATGQVLFAGGTDALGNAQNTAELYDPATNTFTATAGIMVRARQNHVAALLPDGRVLIAGGYNAVDKQLADAEIFDGTTGTFSAVAASLATAREFATATTLLDGRVLIAGGFDGTRHLSTAQVFSDGNFDAEISIGTTRSHHTATLLPSGQVLLAGGYDGSSQLASGTLFIPGTPDSFTSVGPMVQARQDATAVLLSNGKVLLAGGVNGASRLASAELFNPSNTTFSATGSMVVARTEFASGLLLDGTALVAGGTSDGTVRLNSAERFDPQDGLMPFQPDSTITLSTTHAYAGAAGLTASAPAHSGNRYFWSIQNGSITAGQGTTTMTFTMPASGDVTIDLLVISDRLVPVHGRVTVTTDPLPQLISFTSSLDPVPYGGSTTLTAFFSNASSVLLGTGGYGSSDVSAAVVDGIGITVGPLTTTTAYTLTLPTANGIQTSQTVVVHVQPVVMSPVAPSAPTVTASHTFAFSATVGQAVNTAVVWAASGGGIDASGLWTAPSTPGTYTITAKAAADGVTSTSTTATVIALPSISSFTSSLGSVNVGQSVNLTPVFSAPAGSNAQIGTSGSGSSEITASAVSGTPITTGPLSATTTFTLTVTNSAGDSATATKQVTVTQFFSAATPMALARSGHSTTPLADGSVLIAGGTDAADRAEIYSSSTGAFTLTSRMQASRKGHSATLLTDGKVLLAGGLDGTNVLSSAEVFDPSSGTFTLTSGNLLHARQNHAAVLLSDGRVLIAGGSNPVDHELASAELFDPATGTFSDLGSSLQQAREFATATALPNGDVLVAGGTAGGGALASAEFYTEGSFSGSTTFMNAARAHHTATLLASGSVLIAGGSDGSGTLQTAELFTAGSNPSFTTVSSNLVNARERHTATVLANGEVLLAAGTDGNSLAGVGELFDPATGTFRPVGNLITPSLDAGAALLPNGKVIIIGGADAATQPLSAAELFDLHDGQSPDRTAPVLTAPATASFNSSQTASVTLPQGARPIWWVKNGRVDVTQGASLNFTVGPSGTTTIYLLVYTNAGMPILETKDVIGE